jgi:hypothetical protein
LKDDCPLVDVLWFAARSWLASVFGDIGVGGGATSMPSALRMAVGVSDVGDDSGFTGGVTRKLARRGESSDSHPEGVCSDGGRFRRTGVVLRDATVPGMGAKLRPLIGVPAGVVTAACAASTITRPSLSSITRRRRTLIGGISSGRSWVGALGAARPAGESCILEKSWPTNEVTKSVS